MLGRVTRFTTYIFLVIATEGYSLSVKQPSPFYKVELSGSSNLEQNEKLVEKTDTRKVESGPLEYSYPFQDLLDGERPEEKIVRRGERYAQAEVRLIKTSRRHRKEENIVRNWEEHLREMNDVNAENFKKKLVCYYNVPTFEDRPFAVFPEQIDPHLCTHIILGFARIYNSTIQPSNLKDLEFYNRTIGLRKSNKDLKVMLTIGGAGNNSDFHEMVATNNTRAKFIQSCLDLLKKYPFDGFDFDWEFPGWTGPMSERDQFLQFLRELRERMEEDGVGIPILSAAVGAPKAIADLSYNIPELAKAIDFVNLMTYDFHFYSWYNPFTGPNAPLFKTENDIGLLGTLNTAWSAKYWYQNGMPADKIIVGVPTYGHTWRLVDNRSHGYMSLAADSGNLGVKGFISYPEICLFMERNGTQYVFDNETQVPYTYNDRNWISFDNEESATRKAQWVNEFDFGGVMIYCINSDDAWKICNSSTITFPIISAVRSTLFPAQECVTV